MKITSMTYDQSLTYPGTEGEVAKIILPSGDTKMAIFRNGEFVYMELKPDDNGLKINLYDLNKQAVSQLPPMTQEELEKSLDKIYEFRKLTHNEYYMLYGKEISYFTLFQKAEESNESFTEVLLDCLDSIGDIVSVELTEAQDGIEIWVVKDKEATCLYLFPYDAGVVKYGF